MPRLRLAPRPRSYHKEGVGGLEWHDGQRVQLGVLVPRANEGEEQTPVLSVRHGELLNVM